MKKFLIAVIAIMMLCASTFGQTQTPPTLRIVTDDPNLPSDLYYGNTKVKPLRLRPGTNQRITIDDADFFVQQHYIDFLNRFPDASGQTYWQTSITNCGGDAPCIADRRIGVSAAFFIELEFQKTGSYVYRMYKGAIGRQPAYTEFMGDRKQVVDGPGLAASKQAFADAFVQRPEFLQKYPAALTAAQFVDALIATIKQTTGGAVDLTAQRQTYIGELTSGASRGQVTRELIEQSAFQNVEYNRSFVLMQYFGYLRRDVDQAGYDFWLNVLNNREPNNYKGMVNAFITSKEYRDRF